MGKKRYRHKISRYKAETCSRLEENTIDDYGILFATVRFLLDLYIKVLQSNKPGMHIN